MNNKELHRRATFYAWAGFLLVFPINFLVKIMGISVFNVLYLLAFLLLAYGCWLEIKWKKRHWAWLLLLLLYVFGATIIFALKDKSVSDVSSTPAQIPVQQG